MVRSLYSKHKPTVEVGFSFIHIYTKLITMKLTILVDNNTKIDNYLLGEAALSFYIEIDDKKILFDCGYSDIFIQNAFKLKIDLREVTEIVFSHGHNDHTGGLFYLKKLYQDSIDLGIETSIPTIIAHPELFGSKTDKKVGDIGCPVSQAQLKNLFEVNLTKVPKWITQKLIFLGEIPQSNIENNSCIDDSALVYKSELGLVIMTGCSHSGLKNIVEHAKKVTEENKIVNILGGFHLFNKSEEYIKELTKYLKTQNIETISPCHCCDLKSKILLSQELSIQDIGVGTSFEYN